MKILKMVYITVSFWDESFNDSCFRNVVTYLNKQISSCELTPCRGRGIECNVHRKNECTEHWNLKQSLPKPVCRWGES